MLLNAVSSSMYVLDLCWWTKSMANALQKRKKKGGEGGDGGRGEGKGFIIYLFIVLCGTVADQRMLKLQSCLKYAWWYSFPNKLLILLVLFGTGCTVGLAKKQLSLLCFISLITPVEITEALTSLVSFWFLSSNDYVHSWTEQNNSQQECKVLVYLSVISELSYSLSHCNFIMMVVGCSHQTL